MLAAYLPYLVGFSVSVLLAWFLQGLAHRIGLVDIPCARKKHRGDIPLVGGIAMFCGFMAACFALNISLGYYKPLLAGSALLIIVGLLDDFHELSTRTRLVAEIVAALFMTLWGNVYLHDLGILVGDVDVQLGALSVPFTVFCVVALINSFNLVDGLDGVAGSLALFTAAVVATISLLNGYVVTAMLLFTFVAAIGGFLLFNLRLPWQPHARIFMGDSGSMFIGYVLAWMLVDISQRPHTPLPPVTVLWLIAVPAFDTLGVLLRRIFTGHSPWAADRGHFHHILLAAGYSATQTYLIVMATAVAFGAIGLVGHYAGIAQSIMLALYVLLFALYFWGIMHAWKVMRLLSHKTGAHVSHDAGGEETQLGA